ncbi:GNAT family N-acetyltransferase [Spirosoma sp. KCTC 42546]|uniref:GNAT family N-acetyltransferase n=1 Tax=Spirosoma sp. KCTC 42546 TaxID=2520506 RepID=UPI0011571FAD|nr:GNAT family N-acetyltransferase [Spirosoma sp. KCTC 42546]QDK80040.1 GNAT family N-acetyltransferase [Spirosoma sp. KCTC 42546]
MDQKLTFRLATENDLLTIIKLLADDALGALRENIELPLSENYTKAFFRISNDFNQELTVAEINGEIVGTFHISFIQYLTHQGGLRAQIEAVRVHSAYRGNGLGTRLFSYAINRATEKGCHMIQLITDKKRPRAIQFYETLGFIATNEGMKLRLA